MQLPIDRREFLAGSAAVVASSGLARSTLAESSDKVSFVLIGDTHYLANKEQSGELAEHSADITGQLVQTINRLPGLELPSEAGGGKVATLQGVIHAGDIIDTGDKNGKTQEAMQATEWDGFQSDYGLTGRDAKLKFPVYEVHGNHDSPSGQGLVLAGIRERNQKRPGVKQISENGLHYSWDWGPVHFVNLGIVVGHTKSCTQRRRYNPLESLEFLEHDLKTEVGDSKRPVVITHHVDMLRYSTPPNPEDPANLGKEWNPCDVQAFFAALKPYRIAAILYGHTHVRNVFQWNGTAERSTSGYNVFNVDNSSHFHSDAQALFYFEIQGETLLAREYKTTNRWKSGEWTPQVWKFTV